MFSNLTSKPVRNWFSRYECFNIKVTQLEFLIWIMICIELN